ncbi:MAG: UDP-glucose/GDP-mannose dehydrogenase family protein [Mesorhizobium sp.]
MKIAVVGTGYVGLVSGACFAESGHEIACVDKDASKIAGLKRGVVPIFEPGLTDLILANAAAGRLSFTTDLKQALAGTELAFIAVGTPPRLSDGEADLSFVFSAAKEIALGASSDLIVVVKSTVPVGTCDAVRRVFARERPELDVTVVSNPEFLREGSAIKDFQCPDRIVIGAQDARALQAMRRLYARQEAAGVPLQFTANRTAELIKYAANAFLALKVSFINEMADVCEQADSDIAEVSIGMGLDHRIGQAFLNAGPGFGGSCFPKDTMALLRTSQEYGVPMRLVQETIFINDSRKRRMAQKVIDAFDGDINGKTVAVLGLTFKPDTDDMRESPAIPLIETLQKAGAIIRAYDPVALEKARAIFNDVEMFADPYECVCQADAMVMVTDWSVIKKLDLKIIAQSMRTRVLVDLRNGFDRERVSEAGFTHIQIGRPPAIAADQGNNIHKVTSATVARGSAPVELAKSRRRGDQA